MLSFWLGCHLPRAWLSFARGDEFAQIAVDEQPPRVRTVVVAFIRRHQAHVLEVDLGFVAFLSNLKDDVRAFPLALFFHKPKVAVYHVPNDFLAGNEFCYLLCGTVHVLDTVCKFGTEFAGIALNFS
jgi:hypothetical protein